MLLRSKLIKPFKKVYRVKYSPFFAERRQPRNRVRIVDIACLGLLDSPD